MNFLPSADQILVLGQGGRIVESGTFEQLQRAGGYVQTLTVSNQPEKDDATGSEERGEEPAKHRLPQAPVTVQESNDKRRQVGDFTIYRYYFSHVGTPLVFVLLLLEVIWAFFDSFPSKSWFVILAQSADED